MISSFIPDTHIINGSVISPHDERCWLIKINMVLNRVRKIRFRTCGFCFTTMSSTVVRCFNVLFELLLSALLLVFQMSFNINVNMKILPTLRMFM